MKMNKELPGLTEYFKPRSSDACPLIWGKYSCRCKRLRHNPESRFLPLRNASLPVRPFELQGLWRPQHEKTGVSRSKH